MFFHASSPLLSARKAKGTILYSDIGSLPPVTQVFWPEQAFRTRRRPFGTARGRCRRGAGEGAVARSVQTINKPITHGRVCRQGLGPLLKRTVKRTVAGTKFRLRPICVRVHMKMRSSGHLVHVWCTVCLCTYAAGVKRGRGTVKQSTRRADAPPETRVILAPRPRCALVLDRHVQKSAGTTMRSIFLENALAGA